MKRRVWDSTDFQWWEFSINALVLGIGLLLCLAFFVGIVALSRFVYCWKEGCGESQSVTSEQTNSCGIAPNFYQEAIDAGGLDQHPIFADLMPRLQQTFNKVPQLVDTIQYCGYVFIDWQSADDGNYYLVVYEYQGGHWIFISLECQTCGLEPQQQ